MISEPPRYQRIRLPPFAGMVGHFGTTVAVRQNSRADRSKLPCQAGRQEQRRSSTVRLTHTQPPSRDSRVSRLTHAGSAELGQASG